MGRKLVDFFGRAGFFYQLQGAEATLLFIKKSHRSIQGIETYG